MQRKNGISLIVLVITIIVMIILAATIIISLNNTNVIEKANNAVKNTDLATVTEMANVAWGEAYASGKRMKYELKEEVMKKLSENAIDLAKYTVKVDSKGVRVRTKGNWTQNKTIVTNGSTTLEVGKKVKNENNELPKLPNGLNWCILGAEDGDLLLTTDSNILESFEINAIKEKWTIKIDGDYTEEGDWGWLTAIDKLDNECKRLLKAGSKTEEIRSIKVEDIDRLTGYDPTQYTNYGSWRNLEVTYPDGYNVIGTINTNYYYYYPKTLTTNSTDELKGLNTESDAYKILFGNSTNYWVASSYVFMNDKYTRFALRRVRDENLSGFVLYDADEKYRNNSYGIRPVIVAADFIPTAAS